MKKRNPILKILSFILCIIFMICNTTISAEASTILSKAIKNAYIDTLDLRLSWGEIEDICNNSINCGKVFSDYYEALEAYDEDSDNAYYGIVYMMPKKATQKTTHDLGTPVDFLEYTIVGFLNEDNERDVEVYKCKGTLWFKKASGEYIISKAKRTVTLLNDYKEAIGEDETVDSITEQIVSFVDDDYDNEKEEDISDDIKLTVTNCPRTSSASIATISGKVSYEGEDFITVTINDESVEVDEYNGTWSQDVSLKKGTNTFFIVATNSMGKTDSITKKITYHLEAPTLIVDNCQNNSFIKTITISGTVKDNNDNKPKVYINDNLIFVNYSGEWSTRVTLNVGENQFIIKATNNDGKTTTIKRTVVFTADAPSIAFTYCPSSSTKRIVTISGKITDVNDDSPKLYINNEAVSVNNYTGIWSKVVTLVEGDNALTVKAINSLGLITTVIRKITFSVGAPELTITVCPDSSTTKTVTISGKVTDVNDKNPTVYINGDLLPVNLMDGSWSATAALVDGINIFEIKATNSYGKSTVITKNIIYVNTPPVTPTPTVEQSN